MKFFQPNSQTEVEMGTAPVSGAVFRVLAENNGRTEKFPVPVSVSRVPVLNAWRAQRRPRRARSLTSFLAFNSTSEKSARSFVWKNSIFLKRREQRAFTLVEILIAVGILGMIMVAIYACWNSILRGSKAGQEAAADAQRGRMAINTVEMALGCAQMFEANLKYYSFIADTSGDFAYLSFVGHLPESFPGSGLFGDQVLRRVSFGVENKDGDRQLVMRQMPMLQPLEKGEEAYPIVLAHGVNKFLIEFWEPRKGEWIDAWMQNKQLLTNQLPRRVRVALAFGGRNDRQHKREADVVFRDIALPSITVPRAYQLGVGGPGNPGGVPPPTNSTGRGGTPPPLLK